MRSIVSGGRESKREGEEGGGGSLAIRKDDRVVLELAIVAQIRSRATLARE